LDQVPPTIGGYNRLRKKPSGTEILSAQSFRVKRVAGSFVFSPEPNLDPLLVVGTYGSGRVAAFASDAAPHWVGGLVDWGEERIRARAEGAEAVEVGSWYARLFQQMISWVGQLQGR
jgi:hypothetical protein